MYVQVNFLIQAVIIVVAVALSFFWGSKKRIGLGWSFFFLVYGIVPGIVFILLSPPKKQFTQPPPSNKKWDIATGILSVLFCLNYIKQAMSAPERLLTGVSANVIYNLSFALFFAGLSVYLFSRQERNTNKYLEYLASQEENEDRTKNDLRDSQSLPVLFAAVSLIILAAVQTNKTSNEEKNSYSVYSNASHIYDIPKHTYDNIIHPLYHCFDGSEMASVLDSKPVLRWEIPCNSEKAIVTSNLSLRRFVKQTTENSFEAADMESVKVEKTFTNKSIDKTIANMTDEKVLKSLGTVYSLSKCFIAGNKSLRIEYGKESSTAVAHTFERYFSWFIFRNHSYVTISYFVASTKMREADSLFHIFRPIFINRLDSLKFY